MNRVLRLLAVLLLLTGALELAIAGPVSADPIGSCTLTSGVIVAVDFGHWGGNVQRGCDATPSTGLDALHAAGFSTTGTRHDGPAFICRINDYPTAAEEDCVLTPPASAYWSYWHANAGQNSWSYSNLGASSYRPSPGSVDAWVFGGTDIGGTRGGPTFTPAAVRASVPTPVATTPHPPRPTGSAPAGSVPKPLTSSTAVRATEPPGSSIPPTGVTPTGSVPSGSLPSGSLPSGPAQAAASARRSPVAARSPASASSADRGGVTSASPAPSTSQPRFVDVAAGTTGRASTGSALPALLAVGVAGTLAAGAGWAARRRRQDGRSAGG